MSDKIMLCYTGIVASGLIVLLSTAILMLNPKKIINFLNKNYKSILIVSVIACLAGKYIAIFAYFGVPKYIRDTDLFILWANMLNDNGLQGFISEYPALYLYIISGLEYLLRLFGFGDNYIITTVVIKLPAIICEVILSLFVFKTAKRHLEPAKALLITLILLFSTAHIINSSMWGQVDGIFILFLVISFYYLDNNKRLLSTIFYLICAMIKVQAIFFAPIYGMVFIMPLLKNKQNLGIKNIFKEYILPVVICVIIFTVMTIPFKNNITDIWILDFFKHITKEHPFNTNSALNLFGLHGGNSVPYDNSFMFFNYRIWGYTFIVLTCIVCAVFTLKTNGKNIYLLGAFCMASVYTLGLSMHERYILPVIALLLMSYIYTKDINSVILAVVYTILCTINQCMVLFDLFGGRTYEFKIMSGVSVTAFVYLCVVCITTVYSSKKSTIESENNTHKNIA